MNFHQEVFGVNQNEDQLEVIQGQQLCSLNLFAF